ncbi:MAG: hypothetical protein EBS32_02060 [Actinobacteria bacterium]|nr:hypothetical protein [Actinomycetota bacterium]
MPSWFGGGCLGWILAIILWCVIAVVFPIVIVGWVIIIGGVLGGMPGPELWEESEQGRVLIGGCIITPNQPNKACTSCDWDDAGPRPDSDEDLWGVD